MVSRKKPGSGVYGPLLSGDDLSSRVIGARKNLWLIPSELDLAAAELELSSEENYLLKLRQSLQSLKSNPQLQAILIDCPLLGLLSMNSLCAADHLIVTLQSEYLALEGLSQIVEVIGKLKGSMVNSYTFSWWNSNDHVRQSHKKLSYEVWEGSKPTLPELSFSNGYTEDGAAK